MGKPKDTIDRGPYISDDDDDEVAAEYGVMIITVGWWRAVSAHHTQQRQVPSYDFVDVGTNTYTGHMLPSINKLFGRSDSAIRY